MGNGEMTFTSMVGKEATTFFHLANIVRCEGG